MKKALKEDPRAKEGDPPSKRTTRQESPPLEETHDDTIDVDLDELGLPIPQEEQTEATRSRARPKRTRRVAVNPATLKIETDVAMPPKERRGRGSAWIPVLKQLEVGDSLNIPNTTAAKMGYVRAIAKKLGLNVVVRGFEGGARLWRVGAEPFKQGDGL